MRAEKVLEMLLCLQGARVVSVDIDEDARVVELEVTPTKQRHFCPKCPFATRARYDAGPRRWRHISMGVFKVFLKMQQCRLTCPKHGVITELVPWAEHDSVFTRDFEEVITWMAKQMPKTAIVRLASIAWRTVGHILQRTVKRKLDDKRLEALVEIGIDEVCYRAGHKYLSIIADHITGDVAWIGEGKSGASIGPFFDQLGPEGCARIQTVSMDMGPAFIAAVRERCPNATLVFDPFHVVKLANEAVDAVRRQEVRSAKGTPEAMAIKGTRWTVLKAPESHTDADVLRLREVARINGPLYRAYLLKEEIRTLYHCTIDQAPKHLAACIAWAVRSRLKPMVKLGRTLRKHRDGILAAIQKKLSNARLEGINNKVGVLKHRAYGFHSAGALISLIYLCCSHLPVSLPW